MHLNIFTSYSLIFSVFIPVKNHLYHHQKNLSHLRQYYLFFQMRDQFVHSIISRSVMSPMAFSRTERMKHFMEALSMGKGLKFSLRAFKKPLLTEEEYQLLSYLQREGDVSCHLKCLKEEAKSREPNLADSRQEQIQREFISRVAQLYYKKQLVIDNIRREDCLEANGTSVLAQAV